MAFDRSVMAFDVSVMAFDVSVVAFDGIHDVKSNCTTVWWFFTEACKSFSWYTHIWSLEIPNKSFAINWSGR